MKKRAAAVGMAILVITGLLSTAAFAAYPASQSNAGAEAAFEVVLKLGGDIPEEDMQFTFRLESVFGAPLPENPQIVINGEGSGTFEKICFTEPGRYIYTVSQLNGGMANWKYDEMVYTVTVSVEYDESGDLTAVYTAYGKDLTADNEAENDGEEVGKAAEILFVNEYSDPDALPVSEDNEQTTPAATEHQTENEADKAEIAADTGAYETEPPETEKRGIFSGAPQTGEDSIILLWTVLMYIGLVSVVVCIRHIGMRRKNGDNTNEKSQQR